jgi:uncharacterized protein (DUF1684 family)
VKLRVIALAAFMLAACGEKPVEQANAPATPPAAPKPAPQQQLSWDEEIRQWQGRRATNLQKEDGWLTLTGLYWLEEGENSVGSAEDSRILLPPSAPKRAGAIVKKGDNIVLKADPASGLTVDGKAIGTETELLPDTSGNPTILRVGTVTFHTIERAGKSGVRIRDSANPARTAFKGLEYYPIEEKWRVQARFVPYNPPKRINIVNVLGMTDPMISPGALVFEIDGKEYRLDPLEEEGSDELFIIFGDKTNGKETYGAGRYLYSPKAGPDGIVTVDFNKAYNPPCAFTAFATCPLPPKQNKLAVAIPAGEKNYKDAH